MSCDVTVFFCLFWRDSYRRVDILVEVGACVDFWVRFYDILFRLGDKLFWSTTKSYVLLFGTWAYVWRFVQLTEGLAVFFSEFFNFFILIFINQKVLFLRLGIDGSIVFLILSVDFKFIYSESKPISRTW